MRSITFKLSIFAALLALGSCKDDRQEYKDTGFGAVAGLLLPEGDEPVYLRNSEAAETFEWQTVTDGAVSYEVAFYATASGSELYRFVPEDGAPAGNTEIPHITLDAVAALAEIPTGEEGSLWWTVYSKKGIAEKRATAAVKELPLKRFTGFAELPVSLYITGEATEGGTDITRAQQFRCDDPNMFVIYTELKGGQPYRFINNNAGSGYRTFSYVDGSFVEDGDPMSVDADGLYRLTVNLNRYRYTVETISDVTLYYPAGITEGGTTTHSWSMEYQGGGVWKMHDYTLAFTDDLYQFRAVVNGSPVVWGHSDESVSDPPRRPFRAVITTFMRTSFPETMFPAVTN